MQNWKFLEEAIFSVSSPTLDTDEIFSCYHSADVSHISSTLLLNLSFQQETKQGATILTMMMNMPPTLMWWNKMSWDLSMKFL